MLDSEMDAGAWSCGMVVGLIHGIPTVAELVQRIESEAKSIVRCRSTGLLDGGPAVDPAAHIAHGTDRRRRADSRGLGCTGSRENLARCSRGEQLLTISTTSIDTGSRRRQSPTTTFRTRTARSSAG
jgi:hypothetical protein